MGYVITKRVVFGSACAGLATVGYQLADSAGDPSGERITAGVYESPAGSGNYGASVEIPDGWHGSIQWDAGTTPNRYAVEEINSDDPALVAAAVAARLSASTVTVLSPFTAGGEIRIERDYDYRSRDSLAIIPSLGYTAQDLTGATVTFTRGAFCKAAVVESPGTADQAITVEITRAESLELDLGRMEYRLDIVLFNTDRIPGPSGMMSVRS